MLINPDAVVARHPDAIATEIDGEVMLMSLGSGRTFGLDRRASRIWALLEQPSSPAALAEKLVLQYDTTVAQCQTDVITFLNQMVANDLVTVSDALPST